MKGTVTDFDISDTLAVQRKMIDLVWHEKGLNKDLVFDRATNQITNDRIGQRTARRPAAAQRLGAVLQTVIPIQSGGMARS